MTPHDQSAAADRLLTTFRRTLGCLGSRRLDDFLAGVPDRPVRRPVSPRSIPAARHLPACAAAASPVTVPLVDRLATEAAALPWGRTYGAEEFAADFLENYGWMELIGVRGPFVDDWVAGGFLLLGPEVHYPDHRHRAEEIYVPLTGGALWRAGAREFEARSAGAVIHHPSNVTHAMKTQTAPLLAAYFWRGGDLTEKSEIA